MASSTSALSSSTMTPTISALDSFTAQETMPQPGFKREESWDNFGDPEDEVIVLSDNEEIDGKEDDSKKISPPANSSMATDASSNNISNTPPTSSDSTETDNSPKENSAPVKAAVEDKVAVFRGIAPITESNAHRNGSSPVAVLASPAAIKLETAPPSKATELNSTPASNSKPPYPLETESSGLHLLDNEAEPKRNCFMRALQKCWAVARSCC